MSEFFPASLRSRASMTALLALALAFAFAGCEEEEREPTAPAVLRVAEAGPARLRMEAERASFPLAERLRVRLLLAAPEGWEARFPPFPETEDGLRLVEEEILPPRLLADARIERGRRYLLEAPLPGPYAIPSLQAEAVAKDGDGGALALTTDAAPVTATGVLSEDAPLEIADIRPPARLPAPWPTRTLVLAAAGVLLVTGLAAWAWRRRASAPPPPPPPPDRVALEALEALLREGLLDRGETKTFHHRLSAILRRYVEARYGWRAPERTTEEFLDELRRAEAEGASPLDPARQADLRAFLEHCDRVKFARHEPPRPAIDEAVETVRRFLLATRPAPEGARPQTEDGEKRETDEGAPPAVSVGTEGTEERRAGPRTNGGAADAS